MHFLLGSLHYVINSLYDIISEKKLVFHSTCKIVVDAELRRNEHNNPAKSSEPSKHLRSNINVHFTWAVITKAPKNAKIGKNLEGSFIALWKLDLNKQKDFKRLVLFRSGVR